MGLSIDHADSRSDSGTDTACSSGLCHGSSLQLHGSFDNRCFNCCYLDVVATDVLAVAPSTPLLTLAASGRSGVKSVRRVLSIFKLLLFKPNPQSRWLRQIPGTRQLGLPGPTPHRLRRTTPYARSQPNGSHPIGTTRRNLRELKPRLWIKGTGRRAGKHPASVHWARKRGRALARQSDRQSRRLRLRRPG